MKRLQKTIKSNSLFLAMLVPAIFDMSFTLLGQDAKYWSNYKFVNEASPAWYILSIHPGMFILGSIIWFAIWYWIYKRLKSPINIMLTVGFIAGHCYGAIGWINRAARLNGLNPYTSWYLDILYFVFIGMVCGKLISSSND